MTRVALAVIALMFLAGAVAFVHIAAWYWLRIDFAWTQQGTALAVAGGDLMFAGFLTLLAARSAPRRAEIEALAVRTRALEGVASTLAFSALLMPALRVVIELVRRRPAAE